jgi:hypothetical protein
MTITEEVLYPGVGQPYAPVMDKARRPKFNCDPVGVLEIAERIGVQRQTVAVWRRRHPSFPEARWLISGLPAWDWTDIEPWLKATDRLGKPEEVAP